MKQTIDFMSAHLLDRKNALRPMPVRFFVSGEEKWHECTSFPPGEARKKNLFLNPGQKLLDRPPKEETSASYIYDPADPTPNVGGAIFAFLGAGPQDNRQLEARPDVLAFTSAPLKSPLTIVGRIRTRLFVRSSLQYTDFFARICDVDKNGVSTNICDAIIRLVPGKVAPDQNDVMRIEFYLHTTAHTFPGGHAMRLQVSSGAHPRFARNLGTDEPIGSATRMQKARQELFFGPNYQSSITLPVMDLGQTTTITNGKHRLPGTAPSP